MHDALTMIQISQLPLDSTLVVGAHQAMGIAVTVLMGVVYLEPMTVVTQFITSDGTDERLIHV